MTNFGRIFKSFNANRKVLPRGTREFRTAPYALHLAVDLYASAFDSKETTAA